MPNIEEKGNAIEPLIEQIEGNIAEAAKQLAKLRFWAAVMKHGIDPEEVAVLGFDPLQDKETRKKKAPPGLPRRPRFSVNYARMKDGSRKNFPPTELPR